MLRIRADRWFRKCFVAAIAVAVSAQAAAAQGMTFEMVTKTTSTATPLPGSDGGMTMTSRGSAANGAMRMDVTAVDGMPGYTVGDYMLTTEGRTVLVRPATKTYVDVADQALTMLNSLPPEVVAQMSITGITGITDTVPNSESIEGRPTQHYRTTISYSMGIMGQTIPTTITTQYWIAKLPVRIMNPAARVPTMPTTSSPMAELAKKQIELTPKFTDGAALKYVMTTSAAINGQSMVTTITTEMKNIKEGPVDPATMALPAGYTKVAK